MCMHNFFSRLCNCNNSEIILSITHIVYSLLWQACKMMCIFAFAPKFHKLAKKKRWFNRFWSMYLINFFFQWRRFIFSGSAILLSNVLRKKRIEKRCHLKSNLVLYHVCTFEVPFNSIWTADSTTNKHLKFTYAHRLPHKQKIKSWRKEGERETDRDWNVQSQANFQVVFYLLFHCFRVFFNSATNNNIYVVTKIVAFSFCYPIV